MNNLVVYTANFGGYDFVSSVKCSWNCDFVCFTDSPNLVGECWNIVLVDSFEKSNVDLNRYYKMHPHLFFSEYEMSLYIDSHIILKQDPRALFYKYLSRHLMALPCHNDRTCAYAEGIIVVDRRGCDRDMAFSQLSRYESEGFPRNFGLTENGLIFRRHMDPDVVLVMHDWWHEYRNGIRRDQITLPYVLWKHGLSIGHVEEGPRVSSTYFDIKLHLHELSKPWMSRLVRLVGAKKHRNLFYYIASIAISFFIQCKFFFKK